MWNRGILDYPLSLHCHHQNDSYIKMGSCFNISSIVRGKVTRQCPQTTIFEEKGEPKRIRTEVPPLTSLAALPLGQTGSLDLIYRSMAIIMTHAVDFERAVTARKARK